MYFLLFRRNLKASPEKITFLSCHVTFTPAGFGRTRQLFSGTFAWVNTPLNLSSPDEKDFWWQLTFYSSTIIQNNRTLLRATPIYIYIYIFTGLQLPNDRKKDGFHPQMLNFVDLRILLIALAYYLTRTTRHQQESFRNRPCLISERLIFSSA